MQILKLLNTKIENNYCMEVFNGKSTEEVWPYYTG